MTTSTEEVHAFDRKVAFSRNLGLVTPTESDTLARSRVAIAGLGGVGGAHLEVLARQGIGGFTLADPDTFEMANINRQFGATCGTFGRRKTEVSAQRILDINPTTQIRILEGGIRAENMSSFLKDVDLVIDALDAFLIEPRRLLYRAARAKGIPVVAAGPLGFGATLLVFTPKGMDFDSYYGLSDGMTWEEQFARFILGTSPRAFHTAYLDMNYVSLKEKRGPSSSIGVTLCASLVGTEVLRLLLGWDGVRAAPLYAHYDARRRKWYEGRLRGGNGHPLQRLKLMVLRHRLKKLTLRDGSSSPGEFSIEEKGELQRTK